MRSIFRQTFFLLVTWFCYGVSYAQVSGTIFRDYNGNGTRETTGATIEPGVPNVVINAYNASNALVATTTSATNGTYTFPYTVPVRVEFVLPSTGVCASSSDDFSSFGQNGSNVRFVNAATSSLNYAIFTPDDYVTTTDPNVFIPQYVSGDPLAGGAAGTNIAFKGHPYALAGNPITSTMNLPASEIGATWGVAYSKPAGKIFTSAFIKRHVGLGPMGSGGIYLLTPTATSFTVTQFYDMDAAGNRTRAGVGAPAYGNGSSFSITGDTAITYLGAIDPASGVPTGLGVIGVNGAGGRGLAADINIDSYDPAAFGQVGKVGLGDIEISEDGRYLFVMNLYDRKLYRLTLDNAVNPTTVTAVSSYSLPSIVVNNGVLRPFAVKYHRGKVYVGAVTSGENGGQNVVGGATDLYAYVFELNSPTGAATFNNTPVISYPLNYQKGHTINGQVTQWFPWTSISSHQITVAGEQCYPSPMLTNIDFTDDEAMIMDFTDRAGHQWGYYNFRDLSNSLAQVLLDIGGDILIAGANCGTNTYTLESAGSYTSKGTTYTSAATANNEGPGGGEFFYMDYPPDQYHHETSQGALAILPGCQRAIVTLMDPASPFSGGTAHFSTIDGTSSTLANLYLDVQNGAFSKANGLGDIEMASSLAPLEIGNRVWNDTNGNGVQDANESGIGNVALELFADFDNNGTPDGAALATTTTNNTVGNELGTWYFNVSNVTDGDPNTLGNQAGPQPNQHYLVRVAPSDWDAGTNLGLGDLLNKRLTFTDIGGAGQADVRDNDAVFTNNFPNISLLTGNAGENNHSFDFGFIDCNTPAPTATAGSRCGAGTVNLTATGCFYGTLNWYDASTGGSSLGVGTNFTTPSIASSTTYYVSCTEVGCLASARTPVIATISTPPTASISKSNDLSCTTPTATLTASPTTGVTYLWDNGSTNATRVVSAAGTYSVTVLNTTNNCSAAANITVNSTVTSPPCVPVTSQKTK